MFKPTIGILLVLLFTQVCAAQSTPPSGQISSSIYDTGSGNNAGNVGIGTASPGNDSPWAAPALDIAGTRGTAIIRTSDANGIATLRFKGPDVTDDWHINMYAGSGASNGYLAFMPRSGDVMGWALTKSGNLGIGTKSPNAKLEINGGLRFSNDPAERVQTTAWTGVLCGGDYAESVDVTGERKKYEPGDILVLDSEHPGSFIKSAEPYSTSVAGIYSTKPGVVGRRSSDAAKQKDEIPMAMVGIVPTKVSAENGPIRTGDLLVTSGTVGYAMKGTDRSRMLGAVVGKAVGKLESGAGVIDVLVSLQ